jgi:N6-adenosine-specific RNA methylase IME4
MPIPLGSITHRSEATQISIIKPCLLKKYGSLKSPTADDAVLFLWATNPTLLDALKVMECWGFTYRTNMVWVKDKIGTGFYFRAQHELLLLGIKGKMPAPLEENRPPSVIHAPVREHSRKPDEVYEIIEKMYPNRKYLELFARPEEKRKGWTYWGLEVESPQLYALIKTNILLIPKLFIVKRYQGVSSGIMIPHEKL